MRVPAAIRDARSPVFVALIDRRGYRRGDAVGAYPYEYAPAEIAADALDFDAPDFTLFARHEIAPLNAAARSLLRAQRRASRRG